MRLGLRGDTLRIAFFFFAMGAFYSQFMARMPALKEHALLDDSEVGLSLCMFGLGSIVGFCLCGFLLRRCSSKSLLCLSYLALFGLFPLFGLAPDVVWFCLLAALGGFACGLFDVCMNTQGVLHERRLKQSRMGFLQAGYSAGSIFGALVSFGLAAFLSPAAHFGMVSLVSLAGLLGCFSALTCDARTSDSGRRGLEAVHGRLPFFVFFCGFMELGVFIVEGAVSDWGPILLYSCKGAGQEISALSAAACSLPMFFFRLACDPLRARFGDFPLLFGGGLVGFAGLGTAVLAEGPWLALFGFFLVGAGMSFGVPILMSRAGNVPGVDPGASCAAVSFLGYSGLLFFPPLLGFLSERLGLERALLLPLGVVFLVVLGSLAFRKRS